MELVDRQQHVDWLFPATLFRVWTLWREEMYF